MANWPSKLIDAYRITTSPYRSWYMHRRRRAGQVPVFVLFYHRVADCLPNDWTIRCQDFQQQIDWLEEHFQIVDLQECQRRISSGSNRQPTVAITFDDGYAENCEFALPMLIERRIPVTYFVTLDNIRHQKPFQHDLEAGQELPVNTIESLRALSLAGIEVAAHSRTHPDLGSIADIDQLVDEVITSAGELEDLVQQQIRYFAFPFGKMQNLNAAAFQILKAEGFLGACNSMQSWNEIGGDEFQISRVHGDPGFSRFRNWLSFDPRLAPTEFFEYQSFQVETPSRQSPVLFPSSVVSTQAADVNTQPSGY